MANLHPTMTQALKPFYDAIGAEDPAPTLPALRRGLHRTSWHPPEWLQSPGVRLIVDYAYYPAECGRRDDIGQPMEPDWPASAEIQAVWLAGQDIARLLSEETLQAIEEHCAQVG